MESKMMDIMYRLPSLEGVQECVVNSSTVEEGADPLLFYEKRAKTA
jgi:ATP-dependent Clp protease ATP-binding subunit ClpX